MRRISCGGSSIVMRNELVWKTSPLTSSFSSSSSSWLVLPRSPHTYSFASVGNVKKTNKPTKTCTWLCRRRREGNLGKVCLIRSAWITCFPLSVCLSVCLSIWLPVCHTTVTAITITLDTELLIYNTMTYSTFKSTFQLSIYIPTQSGCLSVHKLSMRYHCVWKPRSLFLRSHTKTVDQEGIHVVLICLLMVCWVLLGGAGNGVEKRLSVSTSLCGCNVKPRYQVCLRCYTLSRCCV